MIAALCLALCLSTALVADGARCGPKQFEFVSIGKIADADASGKGGIYDVAQKIMIDTDRKREVIHQRITTESTHRVQVIYRDGLTVCQLSSLTFRSISFAIDMFYRMSIFVTENAVYLCAK